MTDVYQVLCYILDIECHRHNGTWANVYKMLRPTKKLEGLAIDSSIANRTSSEFTSSTSKLISSYSILTTVVVTLLSGLLIRPIQM